MIIGDKARLAFEILTTKPPFCAALLWIDNVRVGASDREGLAGVLLEALAHFRQRAPSRKDPRLFAEPADQCLAEVENALFGSSDSLEHASLMSERYGGFLFSPNLCESLDDCSIVVVEDDEGQRLIAKEHSGDVIHEVFLRNGFFEYLLAATEKHLQTIVSDHTPPI